MKDLVHEKHLVRLDNFASDDFIEPGLGTFERSGWKG
jgi:hypothetical protein